MGSNDTMIPSVDLSDIPAEDLLKVSAHQLVQIILDNALNRLADAGHAMVQGQVSEKGVRISEVITLIGILHESLDFDQGGEIARQLNDLYHYCQIQLLTANKDNNAELLNEVAGLLGQVRQAWADIAV